MIDHQRSTHQHGLDLDVVGVEGGEGEDTRLARAFLMGTSRGCLRRGKLCFMPNVSFTKRLSQRFASPKVRRIKASIRHLSGASILFILQGFDMITEWDLDGETLVS